MATIRKMSTVKCCDFCGTEIKNYDPDLHNRFRMCHLIMTTREVSDTVSMQVTVEYDICEKCQIKMLKALSKEKEGTLK